MGIKDLNKLIKRFAPGSVKEIEMSDLAGKRLAIDAYGIIHAYKVVEMNPNYPTKLYSLCQSLRDLNSPAIFVFDSGKAMPEKHAARAVRDKRAQVATARKGERQQELAEVQAAHSGFMATVNPAALEQLSEEKYDQMIKLALELNQKQNALLSIEKQLVRINAEDIVICSELFLASGFDIAYSEHEGEAGCVKLVEQGLADFVISTDTDVLCFGDVPVVQNFRGKEPMRMVNAVDVRKEMGLTRQEFIDMCILCGCDFSKKLDGLASMGAYKMIQQHRTIETVLANLPARYQIPAEGWTYEAARHIFLEKPCEVRVEHGELNPEALKAFFAKHNLPVGRLTFDTTRQTNITDFLKNPPQQ